jgi:hypothetical protein
MFAALERLKRLVDMRDFIVNRPRPVRGMEDDEMLGWTEPKLHAAIWREIRFIIANKSNWEVNQ